MPRHNPTNFELLLSMLNAPLPENNKCLEWPRGCDADGYGHIVRKCKHLKAHRFAWQTMIGAIPDGLLVCHRCDNPPCFRVDHLFLGTGVENIRDCVSKGRNIKGAANWKATLTDDQVKEIRLKRLGGSTIDSLSKSYSVGTSTIFRIIHRKTWKHF